ncbi:hypothetical protein GDO81_021929 [Engystomops pustulosus]|uniref:Uncharacterized protein n=1 Tax=Engystomops pustulosus TaxID=76066 RepID=A0AAV6ZP50_ENGPU|nr:hypothetical protein GDO81_021929 [Engystomops pustulosus]
MFCFQVHVLCAHPAHTCENIRDYRVHETILINEIAVFLCDSHSIFLLIKIKKFWFFENKGNINCTDIGKSMTTYPSSVRQVRVPWRTEVISGGPSEMSLTSLDDKEDVICGYNIF